jgi:hypothetical protein
MDETRPHGFTLVELLVASQMEIHVDASGGPLTRDFELTD